MKNSLLSIKRYLFSLKDETRAELQKNFLEKECLHPPSPGDDVRSFKVLVIGIYLTDHPNQAEFLAEQFSSTDRHQIRQEWIALGKAPPPARLEKLTVRHLTHNVPKFEILNGLLDRPDLDDYDYVIFSDDDVTVQKGFIDTYLAWVSRCNFSIAQPARSRHSYRNHKFVLQSRFAKARETRFVEIGPVFSFDRAALKHLLPFDLNSPMGWGYDYVWPAIAKEKGMKMGVIDATPVDHSYRAQSKTYNSTKHRDIMRRFLSENRHLHRKQAKRNLRYYF